MRDKKLQNELAEAAKIMSALPAGQERGFHGGKSSWPAFHHNFSSAGYLDTSRPFKLQPTPQQIDSTYYLLDKLMQLERFDRILLWARANKVRWASLQARFRLSRAHLNRRYDIALQRLSEQKKNKTSKTA